MRAPAPEPEPELQAPSNPAAAPPPAMARKFLRDRACWSAESNPELDIISHLFVS